MYKLIVPTGDDLTTVVKVGMYAKLVFTEHKEMEGMWVKVTEVDGDKLVGTLSNDPISIPSVKHGDTVHFTYNHVREFFVEEVKLTIEFEGKAYTLTQEPYIDSDYSLGHERTIYKATAVDREGKDYSVTWLPVEGYKEMEDESACCDWDSPESVRPL